MTEQRPFYHASSGAAEPTGKSPTTTSSPLVQYCADGTVASDTILLIPVLVSPLSHEQPMSYMQLVHLDNGDPGFCNAQTREACACCTAHVCVSHSRLARVSFPDEAGVCQGTREALLCETCLALPLPARYALHAFVVAMNKQGVQL